MSENRAKSTLEAAGLTVADVQTVEVKDESSVNVVVKQSIEPGKSVQEGTAITIYIGYKKEEKEQSVDVSNVIGMTGSEAIEYLVSLGFKKSNITLAGTGNRNDIVESASSSYAKPSQTITLYMEKISEPSDIDDNNNNTDGSDNDNTNDNNSGDNGNNNGSSTSTAGHN